jgi:hypothetical protein
MKDLPLSKVYQLLEPGPVVLLTTTRKGHANIMAMSWYMSLLQNPLARRYKWGFSPLVRRFDR